MKINWNKVYPYIIILIITIISFVFSQYSVFDIDISPYLGFDTMKDGVLWHKTSLFDEFLNIGSYLGINKFKFINVISFIIRYIIFFFIYKISSYLTKHEITGYLTSFFFIWSSIIYGSVTSIIGSSITPRTIAFGLCLAGLYLYLRDKKVYTTSLFVTAGLFHVGTAVSTFLITLVMELMEKKKNYLYLIINLISLGLTGLIFSSSLKSTLTFVDNEWFNLILKYNSAMILGEWSLVAITKLFISFILIYYWVNKKDDLTGMKLLNSSMLLFLFALIFTTFIPVSTIINLQLGRGMYVLLVMFIAYLIDNFRYTNIGYYWIFIIFLIPNYLTKPAWLLILASLVPVGLIIFFKEKKEKKIINYIIIALIILILSLTVIRKENEKFGSLNRYSPITLEHPGYVQGYSLMCQTMGNNTVITEPYSTTAYELAYHCGIKSYYTNRERASVTITKEWAKEIDRRSWNINNINEGGLEEIKKDGVKYIIGGPELKINGVTQVLNISDVTIWKIK